MLTDKHLRHIEDFENASEVFPGVDIAGGVCYFLRSQSTPDEQNMCTIANNVGGDRIESTRPTDEFDILIRQVFKQFQSFERYWLQRTFVQMEMVA